MKKSVAVVTAAGRGMGAVCARELSHRGYDLVLMARSESVEILADELGAVAVRGDVTAPDDLGHTLKAATERFGRIDAVVANTGHPPKGDLLSISDDDWHQGLDLTLLNVVRIARLVVPVMEKQGGGAIVNISAFGAKEPSLTFPVSSALRAALSAYTRLFSNRYAHAGIRMNCVLPGFIDSYPVDHETSATIPMGRAGSVAEIAKTVAFLISGDAGYISGQSLCVDGGLVRSF